MECTNESGVFIAIHLIYEWAWGRGACRLTTQGKIYVCPHCGHEDDLAREYEETAPEITKEAYVVK